MFCLNCGNQIPENTKFCNHCGAPQSSGSGQTSQPYMSQQPVAKPKRKTNLRVGGIILLVLGVFSVIGAFFNGTYQYMQYSFDLSDMGDYEEKSVNAGLL